MTLDTLIMLTGAFVALLPFLGFPNSWDNVLFFIAGILVIAFGVVVRRNKHRRESVPERRNSTFVESAPLFSAHEKETME